MSEGALSSIKAGLKIVVVVGAMFTATILTDLGTLNVLNGAVSILLFCGISPALVGNFVDKK